MTKKLKTTKPGRVRQIIKPIHPSLPEQAEIEIHDADHLYREIRIKNELEDEHGKKVKLKENADVDVVVEADPKATTPA
jgi:predicted nucleotidyltransferase